MPCQSWSRARHWDGGPSPLRDDSINLFGYQRLSAVDRPCKTLQGNALLHLITNFVSRLTQMSVPWVIENPWTSRCWLTSHFLSLERQGARLLQVDYCQYMMPWRRVCSHFHAIEEALQCCSPLHGRCSATGRKHIVLSGQDSSGAWWSMRAQAYPRRLCRAIASSPQGRGIGDTTMLSQPIKAS